MLLAGTPRNKVVVFVESRSPCLESPEVTCRSRPTKSPSAGAADLEGGLPSAVPLLRQWGRLAAGDTARKGCFSLADQVIVSGTSFFTSVIVGRVCGPAELGIYSLSMGLAIFVGGVQESLISTPYTILTSRLQGAEQAAVPVPRWPSTCSCPP